MDVEEILAFLGAHVLPHWPFAVVLLVFTIIGQFTSKKLFTRQRAYQKVSGPWYQPWKNQWFWWWGRETLSLHPILTGVCVGLVWQNPELASPAWPLIASVGYFAGAGVGSLFAWNLLKTYFKQRGLELDLPGESNRPPPLNF